MTADLAVTRIETALGDSLESVKAVLGTPRQWIEVKLAHTDYTARKTVEELFHKVTISKYSDHYFAFPTNEEDFTL